MSTPTLDHYASIIPQPRLMQPEEFRQALDNLGIGQRDFASLIGVHERTVRSWGHNKAAPSMILIIMGLLRVAMPIEATKRGRREALELLINLLKARVPASERAELFEVFAQMIVQGQADGSIVEDPDLPERQTRAEGEIVKSINRTRTTPIKTRTSRPPDDVSETPERAARIVSLSEFRDRQLPRHDRLKSLRDYADAAEARER